VRRGGKLLPYPAAALLVIVATLYARGWFYRRDVRIATPFV
jgi:hypothetical protein